MNSLNGVLLFVHVAEAGSFVGASRLSGISASAVSKSMARLEQRLSARLFHRSTRSVSLTPEGQLYLQTCRQVLRDLQSVESKLALSIEHPQGRLKISLPMVGGFLLPALSDFSARYPEVALDLDFSDRLVDVIAEGFDVVVRTGPLRDSRLSARPLLEFGTCIVGSPAYFQRKGIPGHPLALVQHDCLHYRFPHSGKTERWRLGPEGQFDALGLPDTMICNSLEARIHYARQGRGIAWVPDFSVAAALDDGSLVSVLEDFVHHRDTFSMVWPSGAQVAPRLRAFIDFMGAAMAGNASGQRQPTPNPGIATIASGSNPAIRAKSLPRST
ncbi:LysR family transcriptional regulator [Pseudoxanthomonas sp.]|uniref:LysR family transcriptional regulator n=1 Tax=Pseudoxanthomonas sp. TaxID=1871049 RepID=UPI0026023838|nr:LysR family transcriptional regulator [Pseudoxanthomonas sp.]WDS37380.1 MAG: LysR family transcriptional regulator [Pseudoxanthomonas sp.]